MSRTALITGGSRGIGFGIAKHLANSGFDLAINGVREEDEVRKELEPLNISGRKVIYCQGNIGLDTDRRRIIDQTIEQIGTPNVLVNNAGIAPPKRIDILELEEEDYDQVMDINLRGTFFLSTIVAKQMIREKMNDPGFEACIINIGSVSAVLPSTDRAVYCLSKSGIGMLTTILATRLGEYNFPVYEIRPGIIQTDMTQGVKEKYDKLISEGWTIERRWGTPDDIGKIATVLATGELPYSTGQIITADGGLSIERL